MNKLTCCVAVAVVGLGGQAVAGIINVPPGGSIQAAINIALNGDEIVVAPGTYFEAIDFLGKAITLRSADGPDVTVIDGTGDFHVVQCVSDEGPDTILDGFTITGGDANGNGFPDDRGGGMYNSDSSPTVTNCTFSGNSADHGGGMYNSSGFNGGDSSPTVTNCTFSGNSADLGGGGMTNVNSSPTVTGSTFEGNTANQLGGGMFNFESSPTVTNCTFSGNTATVEGGGMFNSSDSDSSPTVTNCTFSGNSARTGGGMFNVNYSSPTVTNCILWGNSPDEYSFSGLGTPIITHSDVQGGWPGLGNIDADPQFVDPDNVDFRLSPGSPCIDAGHNWAIAGITDTDLDGNPRFADDPATADTGCGVPVTVDMGAYEFQGMPATIKLGDIDGDGAVAVPDLLTLLAAWGPAGGGCQLADFDLDGIVGVPDLLILLANWG